MRTAVKCSDPASKEEPPAPGCRGSTGLVANEWERRCVRAAAKLERIAAVVMTVITVMTAMKAAVNIRQSGRDD